MAPGIGIGIGIGMNQGGGRKSPPAENMIKTAIKERKHVRAVRVGAAVLLQPYALFNANGTRILHAVIVATEGGAVGGWEPVDIIVSDLSAVEVYDLTFIPADAFDPIALDGVVAVIEDFNPFQNVGDASGADA